MNKIAFMLLLALLPLLGSEFHSYEEALKLQNTNHKIILLDVVRSDCKYCIKMDRDVFKDKRMKEWLEKRFILSKINLDKETLPLGIKVNFTPSFFFINKSAKIVKKIPGSWSIEDFKELTKNIK